MQFLLLCVSTHPQPAACNHTIIDSFIYPPGFTLENGVRLASLTESKYVINSSCTQAGTFCNNQENFALLRSKDDKNARSNSLDFNICSISTFNMIFCFEILRMQSILYIKVDFIK